MKKQVAVIGIGRLGFSLATTLFNLGHEVLAIDTVVKNIESIASKITHAVEADATSESVLQELGIRNFDIAIVTMSEIENSVLTTLLLKKMGVPYVIARADNELHGSILERLGADKVVYPEREMGVMVAHVLSLGNIIDFIDYIPVSAGYGAVKFVAPASFIGSSLSSLGFGAKGEWKVAVLLIQRKSDVIITPSDTEKIVSEDILVVSGNWDSLEQLFGRLQSNKTIS